MTNEERQLKRSIISRIVIITVIGVMLGLLVVTSFGWFASNSRLTSTGMSVVVRKMDYEIIIERGQYPGHIDEFDRKDNEGSYVYNMVNGSDGLKSRISGDNYDLSAFNTAKAESGKVAFEIVNETHDADGMYYLRPGAYGTVTFYIRPKAEPLSANFIFECGGYEIVYNETKYELEEISDTVKNLLRGHILFFTGRVAKYREYNSETDASATRYNFSSAENGDYVVDDSEGNELAALKIGSNYYRLANLTDEGTKYSIVENEGGAYVFDEYDYSGLLQDEGNDGVFKFAFDTDDPTTYVAANQSVTVVENAVPVTYNNCYKIVLYWEWPITYDEMIDDISEGKYPSDLTTFYRDNPQYFFVEINNVEGKTRDELTTAYNNADQFIGDFADFLVLYLTAS